MIVMFRSTKEYLCNIDIKSPIYLFVTVTGVKGAVIKKESDYLRNSIFHLQECLIDRDILKLPDIQIDDLDEDSDIIIKPALDALWQASGWACCPNYDENGRWKQR